jgi:bifunctional enzyme CysN/CysC
MTKEHMNVVIVGHVDHGKSTILGRLLAETKTLPEGKLEKLKKYCEKNSKPFEYAFLLDALGDEMSQGITIDIARCFFATEKRKYILLDAPGHIEFLRNLVTGAANAEAAFLVIDAKEGIQENSRRHAYMLSLLGIKQVAVLINKVDLIDYDETAFKQLKNDFGDYLKQINMAPLAFIPVSGMQGDNITTLSENTPWYQGESVLGTLEGFYKRLPEVSLPFRMLVQDVYKFTRGGDNRRIVAGQVETGVLKTGDSIVFYPSGKTSTVKTIEGFNMPVQNKIEAGASTGFTLTEQIYIKRGEVAALVGQPAPTVASTLKVSLFWLGLKPLKQGNSYWLKIGTEKTKVTVEKIFSVLDTSSLGLVEDAQEIKTNQAGECLLKTQLPVAFDSADSNLQLSRFVLVDDYNISGGGIIQSHAANEQSEFQQKLLNRNSRWVASGIAVEAREQRFKQKAQVILITGDGDAADRKALAISLERFLFSQNYNAYFVGIGNVKRAFKEKETELGAIDNTSLENLAEVLHILLNTGLIVIATAANLTTDDLAILSMATGFEVNAFWLSKNSPKQTDEAFPWLDSSKLQEAALAKIKSSLNLEKCE